MCENPEEIMTVLIKIMKIHYVLKGVDENPETRIRKKGHNKNEGQFGS